MSDKTYENPYQELEDAIEFLENNTVYRVKDAPAEEKKVGKKHELSRYSDSGKNQFVNFLSDGEVIRLAKQNEFGKFQLQNVEEVINKEALKCDALECDGTARVIHYALDNHGIPHYVFMGNVEFDDAIIPLHYWIGLPDGRLVDFKARKWLGDAAPNGIFYPKDTAAIYDGKPVELPMNELLYKLLTEVV